MTDGQSSTGITWQIYAVCMSGGKVEANLLSMSPLHSDKISDDIFGYQNECTCFCATDHAKHICSILKHYNKSVSKNVTHIGGDHASFDIKHARELTKPLVGCRSRCQVLEMNLPINEQEWLKPVVNTCHKAMKKAFVDTVAAAELQNLTKLHPKQYNKTYWHGKFLTVNQYNKLEESFQKICGMKKYLITS